MPVSEARKSSDKRQTSSEEPQMPGTRLIRDWFTGELKEVPRTGGGKLVFDSRTDYDPHQSGKTGSPWDGKDKVNRGLSLLPDEVTPERIEIENAAAVPGVKFDPQGRCHVTSQQAQDREARRQGKVDMNYGCGHTLSPGDLEKLKHRLGG